jgi:hypothetical protein
MGPDGLEMLDGGPSLKERPCPSPRNQVDGQCKSVYQCFFLCQLSPEFYFF